MPLIQDTDYMIEKTFQLAPYLGAFKAYLMPQWPIYGLKGVSIYQNDRWNVAVNSLQTDTNFFAASWRDLKKIAS